MKKDTFFSCQEQSFSARNFRVALLLEKETFNIKKDTFFSCQGQSFSARNFQVALLLEKETLI